MTPQEIRTSYLEFFKSKGHEIVASDSLLPSNDPTLLFTTAGMVQFKALYAGAPLKFSTASTVQKCLRAGGKGSDLENVGRTLRHHTFFEMLGNFSFGDYFKKEAIQYALEYITTVLKIDLKHLWVSVFKDDEEAKEIWMSLGFPGERIVKLGEKDNFWGPAGDEGACGPCSEIYYDLGPERSCGKKDCAVGCDCERYLEFWNLVFPQFYQEKDGKRRPLERRGVDTGMGLERLSFLMDPDANNNYETAIFKPIIEKLKSICNKPYANEWKSPYHVIADHIRALTFSIGDGIMPSNEGRGYVIRRILRRALRFGKKLNLDKPFLFELVPFIIEQMKIQYPELLKVAPTIINIIKSEEEKFLITLNRGLSFLEKAINEAGNKKCSSLDGKTVFMLYDTYGMPLEVIEEVSLENNLTIASKEFKSLLEEQKAKGKQSWKGTSFTLGEVDELLKNIKSKTEFLGYEKTSCEATVIALIFNNKSVENINAAGDSILVLDKTVYYAESGGQIGDTGVIENKDFKCEIYNVQKSSAGIFLHSSDIKSGKIKVGDKVTLTIDLKRRNEIKKHHTATHILQFALRKHLGEHVKQSGSYVSNDRLRFDFSHTQKLSKEQINNIENDIFEIIINNYPVNISVLSLDEAKKNKDIIANFGEKYEQSVRMVNVGGISKELCGGTHIESTGLINGIKIISENSVSAGIRRIEAVVGHAYLKMMQHDSIVLSDISNFCKVPAESVNEKIDSLNLKIKELEKKLNNNMAGDNNGNKCVKEFNFDKNDIKITIKGFKDLDGKQLIAMSDNLKSSNTKIIMLLASTFEDKINYISARKGTDIVNCADLLKEVTGITEGKGGGSPEMARGGGKNTEKFIFSLEHANDYLKNVLKLNE